MDGRRIMRSKELFVRVPYTDTHIRRLERDGQFPKRFKIASSARCGAIGWWADEVETWLARRPTNAESTAA